GWDVFREKVFANQRKLGLLPSHAKLPARNPMVEAWNSLSPPQQKLYARFMEVYAGYLEYTDYQVSRLIDFLQEIKQLEHTLIFVMIGDNGASKEGTFDGVIEKRRGPRYNKDITREEYVNANVAEIDKIGLPDSEPNYPLGWAQACNTPFK